VTIFCSAVGTVGRWARGLAAWAAIALVGCGGTGGLTQGSGRPEAGTEAGASKTVAPPRSDGGRPPSGGIQHVFIIAMENQSAKDIYGSSKAPYINGVLLAQYASASNFADDLPSLPSEPHYIRLEAGTNMFADHTFTGDSSPSASNSTASTDHLATQIRNAGGGLDWTAYVEGTDLTAQPCPISNADVYVPRHDPFLFFQDVSGSPPDKTNATCAAHHRSIDALAGDLGSGSVASYVFVVPDLCHDMHGASSCPAGDPVNLGDTWLSSFLPPLIDFVNASGGVIFVVWDEGSKLPFLAIGPDVKRGYSSPAAIDHASVLKTVEEILGLPVLPAAQPSSDLGDLFAAGAVP
jgi:hypothetical protein